MSLFDAVSKLRGGLDYHLARHNLLTSNLAHLDTPGYKPLDLEREGGFHSVLHTEMESTQPMHLAGSTQTASGKVIEDPTAKPGLDGNAVNVDREAAKVAANQVRYDTLAQLVAGELNGLSWAANDGRNG